MTRRIFHAVICGVILGALAFFVPKLLLGLLILGFIFRVFHCCGRACHSYGYVHRHERMFYLADKIRKMSDEEYNEFKTKMGGGCCSGYHHHRYCCGSSKSTDNECCKSGNEIKQSK